jgi:hypothetical protein
MQPFNQYITGFSESVARVELERLVGRYEWFTSARRARALLYNVIDSRLTLPLLFAPTVPPAQPASPAPFVSLVEMPIEVAVDDSQTIGSLEDEIIDRFLCMDSHRITPDSEESEVANISPQDDYEETDEEFVTEELAEIYRAQGLYQEASKIYLRLSLLNPEKSIYFADAIAQIEKEKQITK